MRNLIVLFIFRLLKHLSFFIPLLKKLDQNKSKKVSKKLRINIKFTKNSFFLTISSSFDQLPTVLMSLLFYKYLFCFLVVIIC